jgi:hypothetical protein
MSALSLIPLSTSQKYEIAVSSLLAMILTFYFAPGGGTLKVALLAGVANALIDYAALYIVACYMGNDTL